MDILNWLTNQRNIANQRCVRVKLEDLTSWRWSKLAVERKDNRFFSIVGVSVSTNNVTQNSNDHAMILQQEIGILGFLIAKEEGQTSLLLQAKAEPGNVGAIQVAPTVQATVSNYSRAHGGLPTPYLKYFLDSSSKLVADSLQSEHGSRFLGKYNRNVMCKVSPPKPEPPNNFWRWCLWDTLKGFLVKDFVINTDTRSVLTCGDWKMLAGSSLPFQQASEEDTFARLMLASFQAEEQRGELTFEKSQQLLDMWRSRARLKLEHKGLSQLRGWKYDGWSLANEKEQSCFLGMNIRTNGREVPQWDQPLFYQAAIGEVTLICQVRQGILHFLLRESFEIGFREAVQLGPTIQTNSIEIANGRLSSYEQLLSDMAASHAAQVRQSCMQSDEGGRFYYSVSRYSLVEIREDEKIPNDESNCWVTLRQIQRLAHIQGMLTNEARSAISLLLVYL